MGVMTIGDYVQILRFYRKHQLKPSDLPTRSIAEVIQLAKDYSKMNHKPSQPDRLLRHVGFQSLDAEESIMKLCHTLLNYKHDYVPIVDPENGNLIAILGLFDVLHMLAITSKQEASLYSMTIAQSNMAKYDQIITATTSTPIHQVLDIMAESKISSVPVLDNEQKVVGIYHRSDVSFIIKANDPEAVLQNLSEFKIEDSFKLKDQLQQIGEVVSQMQNLVTCKNSDLLGNVLNSLIQARTNKAVIVDDNQTCIGILSVKDILRYFFQ